MGLHVSIYDVSVCVFLDLILLFVVECGWDGLAGVGRWTVVGRLREGCDGMGCE